MWPVNPLPLLKTKQTEKKERKKKHSNNKDRSLFGFVLYSVVFSFVVSQETKDIVETTARKYFVSSHIRAP